MAIRDLIENEGRTADAANRTSTVLRWVRAKPLRSGVAAAATAVALSSQLLAATPPLDPLSHLVGRWVGDAVMTTAQGPASFKCIVTYLPRKDGPGMQQNLRCDNGANFKLHAATSLTVEGSKVSGQWKDTINEIEGTVAGKLTPAGFEVDLQGQFFQARMAVSGEGCDQSVKVMPMKSELFRELAATLKKC